MDNSSLLVVAAMERELSLLKKKLDDSAGVTFHTLGIGSGRAYQEIRALLNAAPNIDQPGVRSRAVLLLGFAGAVDTSLEPGDLVLSSRYYQAASSPDESNPGASRPDSPAAEADCGNPALAQSGHSGFPPFLKPDPWMRRQAMEAVEETDLRFTQSPSLTVGRVIGVPDHKRAIFAKYSVATVNMEDYWAATAAREAGVPFLSVRAVLDPADQRLPGYLPSMSAPGFHTALSTFARPWRVGPLLSLAIQMRRAQSSLAQFALSFIPRLTDLPPVACPEPGPVVGKSGALLKCVQFPASIAELTPESITGLFR